MKTLQQWLSMIESQHPVEIELGLARVAQVAKNLGIAPNTAKVVTVAGTNGKGSTCQMLQAILLEQGLKCGVYSSPHFLHYNERIQVNGAFASDEVIINAFTAIDVARQSISLTYFEYATLAALWIFSQSDLDVWILEVGLGGRLDAVNIVDADIAVVTSIALDHTDWLGSDINVIGYEKASIARAGGVLIDASLNSPESVKSTALEIGARFVKVGQDYHFTVNQADWQWHTEQVSITHLPKPSLPIINAAAVLAVLQNLPFEFNHSAIAAGLKKVQLTGRLQVASYKGNALILDVAHNPHAAAYICQELLSRQQSTHIIFAALKDKDIQGTVEALKPLAHSWSVIELSGSRAMAASEIAAMLPSNTQQFTTMQAALEHIPPTVDQTLICGSFLTVSAALEVINHG